MEGRNLFSKPNTFNFKNVFRKDLTSPLPEKLLIYIDKLAGHGVM